MEGTSALLLECVVLQYAAHAAKAQLQGRDTRCFCRHGGLSSPLKIKQADYLNWPQNDSRNLAHDTTVRLAAGNKSGLAQTPCGKLAAVHFRPSPATIFFNIYQQFLPTTFTNNFYQQLSSANRELRPQ